ncbi:hypothetical protein PoB_006909400 [Plakobranchus ocellatus]|uniref:Uncharacterized protein n=1 Tax=Plakobranchus ocellatus TaxID=259542 RepID=A0AAV4DEE4_9GAST|nr:hypothetical protein PoB_006909400 [Plakobranchus ocellatus]
MVRLTNTNETPAELQMIMINTTLRSGRTPRVPAQQHPRSGWQTSIRSAWTPDVDDVDVSAMTGHRHQNFHWA